MDFKFKLPSKSSLLGCCLLSHSERKRQLSKSHYDCVHRLWYQWIAHFMVWQAVVLACNHQQKLCIIHCPLFSSMILFIRKTIYCSMDILKVPKESIGHLLYVCYKSFDLLCLGISLVKFNKLKYRKKWSICILIITKVIRYLYI
jgi:hypothetical protein